MIRSESFPGSGLEDSYKLYAVIWWFKINPDCGCKVTSRCWKANANICALKKALLVAGDLAYCPLVCSLWAGIWSQCKLIHMCIIKEAISQWPWDPSWQVMLPGGRLTSAQGCTSHFEKRCFACASPTYAGKHQGPSLLVTAAARLVSEPTVRLSFPQLWAYGLHHVSTWNLWSKVARLRVLWRLAVGSVIAPPIKHLAPPFCPPALNPSQLSFAASACSFFFDACVTNN